MDHSCFFLLSYDVKGVVLPKTFRGYVEVDSLGETLLFTRTKTENRPAKQISHVLKKKQYPGKFRCLNTTFDVLTGEADFPSARSYTDERMEK